MWYVCMHACIIDWWLIIDKRCIHIQIRHSMTWSDVIVTIITHTPSQSLSLYLTPSLSSLKAPKLPLQLTFPVPGAPQRRITLWKGRVSEVWLWGSFDEEEEEEVLWVELPPLVWLGCMLLLELWPCALDVDEEEEDGLVLVSSPPVCADASELLNTNRSHRLRAFNTCSQSVS